MYGDLGLIMNDPNRRPQTEKGFHDPQLYELIMKGANNIPVKNVSVNGKEFH